MPVGICIYQWSHLLSKKIPAEAEQRLINAAHPLCTGRHDLYAEAMRLVGERHAKGDLVELVNWLLFRLEDGKGEL